ncbi:MAG: hypothetical protein AAF291_08725 [Pseudomonadota bacterium]
MTLTTALSLDAASSFIDATVWLQLIEFLPQGRVTGGPCLG